ncbi:MAG: hypothetical protein ACOCXZ_03450 [Chloroflexota bacterium]
MRYLHRFTVVAALLLLVFLSACGQADEATTPTSVPAIPTDLPAEATDAPVPDVLQAYFIEAGDVGEIPVGCGDSATLHPIKAESSDRVDGDIQARLNALLTRDVGDLPGNLINSLAQTDMVVDSVSLEDGRVEVALTGPLVLVGTCEDARIEGQLLLNVFVEPEVETAYITVDGENIRQRFDMSGRTGPDFVYTRGEPPIPGESASS